MTSNGTAVVIQYIGLETLINVCKHFFIIRQRHTPNPFSLDFQSKRLSRPEQSFRPASSRTGSRDSH